MNLALTISTDKRHRFPAEIISRCAWLHFRFGLSYFDASTGQAALIAEIKSSKGQVLPPNRVIYSDAFDDVKADVDICCTSSNAVKIVSKIPKDRQIIFGPDQHLGRYVASQTSAAWKVITPGEAVELAIAEIALFPISKAILTRSPLT